MYTTSVVISYPVLYPALGYTTKTLGNPIELSTTKIEIVNTYVGMTYPVKSITSLNVEVSSTIAS
jgi:hypothetical protein